MGDEEPCTVGCPIKRQQVARLPLMKTVLKDIGTEEALQFFRCLELTKQLGMLSEGKNAWLKLVQKVTVSTTTVRSSTNTSPLCTS
jgi:hypothetical protein